MTPLTSYIASGQTEEKGRIGLEIEHFVLNDETGAPMPYLELVKLLEFLKESYEEAVYEEDHLIALESNTTLITLEPGCQLELSFRCSANLEHIKTWYEEAIEPIQNYLHRQGYSLVYRAACLIIRSTKSNGSRRALCAHGKMVRNLREKRKRNDEGDRLDPSFDRL